jgi:hypothetical protein
LQVIMGPSSPSFSNDSFLRSSVQPRRKKTAPETTLEAVYLSSAFLPSLRA